MQHPWWFTVRELTRHMAIYSALFLIFVLAVLYGSLVNSLVERAVASKFIVHVVAAVEYAIVVCDALMILKMLVYDVRKRLWRLM